MPLRPLSYPYPVPVLCLPHLLLDLPVTVRDELLEARHSPRVNDVLSVVRIILGANNVSNRAQCRLRHAPTFKMTTHPYETMWDNVE